MPGTKNTGECSVSPARLVLILHLILLYKISSAQLTFTISNPGGNYNITCSNTLISLFVTSSYTGSAVSYTWQGPQTGSVFGNSLAVNSPGIYTVSASAGSLSATQTLAILVNTIVPSVTITPGSGTLTCTSPSIILHGSTTTSSVIYEWFDNLPVAPPFPHLITYTAVVFGIYTLVATDLINGCSGTATAQVKDGRVFPQLSVNHNFSIVCTGGTVDIFPSLTGSTVDITFQWTSPSWAATSGATTQTLNTNSGGAYTVVATNTLNGCWTKTLVEVAMCVGMEEKEQAKDLIKVFPNPAETALYIQNDKSTAAIDLTLLNSLGQVLYTEPSFDTNKPLSIALLPQGLYYLKIQNEGRSLVVRKFVKN